MFSIINTRYEGNVFRVLAVALSLVSLGYADIVRDVRLALAQHNTSAAESALQTYRGQRGADPEYLEASSWVARAYLSNNQLDQADTWAKQVESSAREALKHRALDAEPHLPLALGAALEVEAQVLASRGQNSQAAALLRKNLVTYRTTSIKARLQKNLNMLGLQGRPAPPLSVEQYIGVRPSALSTIKGAPVLLFFWAHWCADCKQEGPVISQLASEFGSRGLKVEAPTQLYGYAAYGENATPKDETAYIGRVWQHYYPGLQEIPVPVSKVNFDRYGASTTPTLVVLDRAGKVALYHPGLMSYDELRAAIERAM
ncbi:MAG TPA: TlpA disulfide reductase family protein [Terriglobales bacterium]|nr:TlpA disulfide reductase family protein [Terriglobales bacterium]